MSNTREAISHFKLALPLVAVQVGIQLMSVVDVIMVGRLSPEALAGVGIGNSLYFVFTLVGLGCITGMDPLISQSIGAGEKNKTNLILINALVVAFLVAFPVLISINLSPLILTEIGIAQGIVSETSSYLNGRNVNVFAFLFYCALRSYKQSSGDLKPIVVSILLANIINLIANTILIFGDGGLQYIGLSSIGLEPMGVYGAGLSSSIAAVVSLIYLIWATRFKEIFNQNGWLDTGLIRKIFKIGVPVGFHFLCEMGAFTVVNMLVGLMGAIEAAAYEIAFTLASFIFTIALGCSAAACVRVGIHIGRNDSLGTKRAGMMSLLVSSLITFALAIFFFLFPEIFAWLLTDNESVIKIALPLIQIAAIFAMADNLQVVASGGLRGAADTKIPFFIQLGSHYLIGIPIALFLGFVLGFGAPGLWWGLTVGLTLAGVILSRRLYLLTDQALAQA